MDNGVFSILVINNLSGLNLPSAYHDDCTMYLLIF